jgi:hypothetical protein
MAMHPALSNGHPPAWPWGMAMYTNLHYHHQYEREQLFEKSLTPSDVGKLNRLVIPKQHAERNFPLRGGGGGDAGEKGLLLSFEDEAGKPWRFRYSYWTSSQSYVLTKGWSRYVKEKRLDAGDVVCFERVRGGLGVGDRLFIGCRRRGESASAPTPAPAPPPPVSALPPAVNGGEKQPWSPMCYSTSGSSYPTSPASSYAYHSDMPHAGNVLVNTASNPRRAKHRDKLTRCREDYAGRRLHTPWFPWTIAGDTAETRESGAAPSRKLRLFGVNLDCGPEPEPETPTAMYGYMHQQSPCAAVSAVPNYWSVVRTAPISRIINNKSTN